MCCVRGGSRYFAETSATLFTTILGQREGLDALGGPFRDYWLSDGTYGSFRIQVAVDGLEPTYSVLRSPLLPDVVDQDASGEGPVLLPCRLWGNSDRDGDVSTCGHLIELPLSRWSCCLWYACSIVKLGCVSQLLRKQQHLANSLCADRRVVYCCCCRLCTRLHCCLPCVTVTG